MSDIRSTIYGIVSETLNGRVKPEEISDEVKISELGINSMTLISILFEMEAQLDLEIAEMMEDMEAPDTIGDLVKLTEEMSGIS